MIILTQYIVKHELKPVEKYFSTKDVLNGCEKVYKNLAIEIRPPKQTNNLRFFKVRIGGKVKGRMIVFLITENKNIVPILIRLKKDKIFGENMSLNNSAVAKQIDKNLQSILSDIEKGNYEQL